MKPLYFIFYRISRRLAWFRASVTRRFTPVGLALLGAFFVTMVMGVDTDHNMEYQAFTLLLALLAQAIVLAVTFRARFSVVRLLPRFATAGSPLYYKVRVRNLSGKAQGGLSLLENLRTFYPSFQEWKAVQMREQRRLCSFRFSHGRRAGLLKTAHLKEAAIEVPIPVNEEIDVPVELTPLKRGLLHFKGITLTRPDPLGLFRGFSKVAAPQKVLVLPKRYALPPFPLPGQIKYQQGGVAMASHVGQSEDFVALRDYRRGDPVRHIHWRSWAKVGKPVVKEFEDEFFFRHALVLDTFASSDSDEVFEEAISVAASFACTVVTQESLLDLLFVGPDSYTFTAGRGLAHADQILEVLASVQICHAASFQTLEALVLNHSNLVSGCIFVLIAWDAQRRELVSRLKQLGVPLTVLVIVPAGTRQPLDLGPMADEPQHFHTLDAGRVEQDLAELKA